MKSRNVIVLFLAALMCLSVACSDKTEEITQDTAQETEVTDLTEDTAVDTEQSAAQEGEVVKAASVPDEDIVFANLDGMSAEEVINNLNNLAKIDGNTTFQNYGERFEVVSPCLWDSNNDNQGTTGIGLGWSFDRDDDIAADLAGHSYLEWVGFRRFNEDGNNELIIRFYVSEDIASDIKDALKEQLLAYGIVTGTDSSSIYMGHPADDVSTNYSITTTPGGGGRTYFRVELPCRAMV